MFFEKTFLRKSYKNVKSRKLKGFEQSYFEERFKAPEIALIAPNFSVENFNFCQTLT